MSDNQIWPVFGAVYKEEILDTKKRWIEKFIQPTESPSQEIEEYEYNNRRLVVSYCPKRANKGYSDRQRLINRLMKKIKKGHIPIKSLISNYGTKKYIVVEKNTTAKLNEAKIEQETLTYCRENYSYLSAYCTKRLRSRKYTSLAYTRG